MKVGWIAAAVVMVKTQIGIGALSIPGAFDVLGVVPGVVIMAVVAIITTWVSII
jgi:amino acid permease